ncbi:MAG: multiheme c-type cytochrome [bacterium]
MTVLVILTVLLMERPLFTLQASPLTEAAAGSQRIYIPAKICGQCHHEIFKTWSLSMHAHAMDDPIFESTYALAYTQTGGKAKKLCLRCHAPTVLLTKDFDQELEITREGITCDFCHAVKDVDLSRRDSPMVMNPLLSKADMNWKRDRTYHDIKKNPVLASSEFCAGCHEYSDENGVSLLGTYTEWKKSPYAGQGISCQGCHIPHAEGKVNDPRMLMFKDSLSGGVHSKDAPPVKTEHEHDDIVTRLENVERKGGNLTVVVSLTNTGSGHKLPTGIPSRNLVLICEVKTVPDGKTVIRQKVYRKKVVDQKTGEEFSGDADLMWKPGRLVEDNRLAPHETRTETFRFMVIPDKDVIVKAYVNYVYQPVLIQKTEMKIQMSGDQKEVPAIHDKH